MAEKRQKKQAAKAFEKETFSMDKEVTGANHTENRQDNIFSTESQFHANEKPVSNLPRDANRWNDTKNVTSGHNVQKSEADAEKAFLKENQHRCPPLARLFRRRDAHVRGQCGSPAGRGGPEGCRGRKGPRLPCHDHREPDPRVPAVHPQPAESGQDQRDPRQGPDPRGLKSRRTGVIFL